MGDNDEQAQGAEFPHYRNQGVEGAIEYSQSATNVVLVLVVRVAVIRFSFKVLRLFHFTTDYH